MSHTFPNFFRPATPYRPDNEASSLGFEDRVARVNQHIGVVGFALEPQPQPISSTTSSGQLKFASGYDQRPMPTTTSGQLRFASGNGQRPMPTTTSGQLSFASGYGQQAIPSTSSGQLQPIPATTSGQLRFSSGYGYPRRALRVHPPDRISAFCHTFPHICEGVIMFHHVVLQGQHPASRKPQAGSSHGTLSS